MTDPIVRPADERQRAFKDHRAAPHDEASLASQKSLGNVVLQVRVFSDFCHDRLTSEHLRVYDTLMPSLGREMALTHARQRKEFRKCGRRERGD